MRPILKHPGYFVSESGLIFSSRCRWGNRKTIKKLTLRKNKDGYLFTVVRIDGMRFTIMAHKAVAEAFIGEAPDGMQVRHLDGNKENNLYSNLLYGTALDNARDRHRHGTTARGERQGGAILSNHQVIEIRKRLKNGERQCTLAHEFGVHKTTIQAITSNRNWTWLPDQQ